MGPGRQRGFSLIIVFLLIMVMVGLAAAVMTTTQGDLQVAGTDREGAIAFYAAEAGVAYAKDWLSAQSVPTGNNAFSAVLASGAVQICAPAVGPPPGSTPGTQPQVANVPVVYLKDAANNPITWYRFCVHNNVDDPNYINLSGNGDTVDSDGKVTIESYGTGPNNTLARVAATVAVSTAQVGVSDYSQQGGGGTKQGRGDTTAINTGTVVRY
jgi:type II secretory pathway pseudopilin PulG